MVDLHFFLTLPRPNGAVKKSPAFHVFDAKAELVHVLFGFRAQAGCFQGAELP
jgi:hypothetical protein